MELVLLAGVALALLLILILRKKSANQVPEIVLYGPSNAGKTKLFYLVSLKQLSEQQSPNTIASMKPNCTTLTFSGKTVRLTDYPGHSYYYRQLLDTLPRCLGMVFLIDSTDKSSFKKAAEELYDLMALRQPKQLLIFCNKQDLPFAKKILMIESELSTEM